MAEIDHSDVIIAGGGFVGMTLALALAKLAPKGFGVALVDVEPLRADKADARASALTAASKHLLSARRHLARTCRSRATHRLASRLPTARSMRRSGRIFSASTTSSSRARPAPT